MAIISGVQEPNCRVRATAILLAKQEGQRAYDCQHQRQGGSGTAVRAAAQAVQAEVVD
jgi:hypothetical protein